MFHTLRILQSTLATILEGGRGTSGTAFPLQPALPIRLYEFEGCPYCRRVREVLTTLNLDVEIYPCPKNGQRFRAVAQQLSGKTQFPLLVDDNTGTVLTESQAIIDYLFKSYGKTGKTPRQWQNLPAKPRTELLVMAARGLQGLRADKGNQARQAPPQLLELWSFEASPFTRLVRERLCALELPYLLRNVAKERWQDMGPAVLRLKPGKYVPLAHGKRERLLAEVGKIQVPYLIDPNTGVRMHESASILRYLNQTYGG